MAYRILAVATDKIAKEIVHHLKLKTNSSIELLIHFGDTDADYKASSLLKMAVTRGSGKRGHIMDNDQFSGKSSALVASEDFYYRMSQAIEHLHRASEEFAYRTHKLKDLFDYQHYYHIIVDRLGTLIRSEKINLVLLFDIPHMFYDTAIYQVAKSLGIDTLILRQSLWCNRFFSCQNVDSFGLLPDLSSTDPLSHEHYTINENTMPDLFYMPDNAQMKNKVGRLTIRSAGHLFMFLAVSSPRKLLNFPYVFKMLSRMHHIAGRFPNWRDPFAKFFHRNSLQYFETLAEFENNEADMIKKFVYFPLHLQPEMTTSALGDQYSDQLLAIERVAEIIPDEWQIYVKENPKQTGQMRSPMFFHRLQRIKNVHFLSSHADTHKLTNHSEFVATVTGTVGWEAICKGKKALVFGRPWYMSLPGVILHRNGLTVEEILNFDFSHADLEQYASWLLRRAHDGTLHRHAAQQMKNFNIEENSLKVADIIVDLILKRTNPTFHASRPDVQMSSDNHRSN